MATIDRFIPSNLVRPFVADFKDHAEQSVLVGVWKTVASSRVAKTIVSVFAIAAIVFAIIKVGNPIALFATTSQLSTAAPVDSKDQSMPAIQSAASAQAMPPAAESPRSGELLVAFKTAFESRTEVVDPPKADASLNQFQAWAAEEDASVKVRSTQPTQDTRAQVAQKAPAKPLPKRRPARTDPIARSQAPPASSQNAQSSLQRLSWHY